MRELNLPEQQQVSGATIDWVFEVSSTALVVGLSYAYAAAAYCAYQLVLGT